MKKFVLIFLLIIYTLSIYPISNVGYADNKPSKASSSQSDTKTANEKSKDVYDDDTQYTPKAEHILVCDAASTFPVYEKNSDVSINPLSLTKILTAITVIENVKDINRKITVPENILKDFDYSYGDMGLMSGEVVSIKDLLYAMMLYDAGDSAIALAHTTSNKYSDFIKLMNSTAQKAGAKKSVFTEPVGFNGSKQKTTLSDMAKITSYALKNELFSEIVKTSHIKIEPTNKCSKTRTYFNTNRFLSKYYSEDYYNPNIYGVKDYRKDETNVGLVARYCVGNDDLLILTAKSYDDNEANYAYLDTSYLIDKYKGYFTKVSILEKEDFVSEINLKTAKDTERLLIVSMDNIVAKLPKDYKTSLIKREIKLRDNIDAPLKKYEELGEIIISYEGVELGRATVASNNEVKKSITKSIKYIILNIVTSLYFWIIIVVFIFSYYIKQKRKKNNKRK